ncbi:MAG TPA: SGNH/GDSL hydrolase family protein [Intrasporangium sp.]|uniref:SGNH/GDSL hydrolase family protein n=1 Tax=Intrasporangium sp. TaxID=1925024 RepID=UPI002D775D12|nr:SGNH/GDSL hydrolase family protein [Intrasporangium sp.]HET7398841.1 SGNH/GDSL hydrolase family protein [Intrasporangium sp.]
MSRRLLPRLASAAACVLGLLPLLGCSAIGTTARPSPTALGPVATAALAGAAPGRTDPAPRMTLADPLRLVVLGDSVALATAGCDHCLGFDRQYATYLRTVTGRSVLLDNLALPQGDVAGLRLALTSDEREAIVATADIVVVSVGFDDGPPWRPGDPCRARPPGSVREWAAAMRRLTPGCVADTLSRYAAELDGVYATVERLAAGHPQVRVALGTYNPRVGNPDVLGRSVPAGEREAVMATSVAIAMEWNRMDCATARRHGFVCADIWRAFNGADGREQLRYLYGRDGLHPSATGQLEITERLAAIDISTVR